MFHPALGSWHLPLLEGVASQYLHGAQRQAIGLEGLEARQRWARPQRHRARAVGLATAEVKKRVGKCRGSLGLSGRF